MIEISDLTVTFRDSLFGGKVKALDEFSISVKEGNIYGLLGPNGAGKSTAMYCMLGLVKPDSGKIRVMGQKPRPGSPLYEDIVYLPEEPHYYQHLSVKEAVDYYANLYHEPVPDSERRDALEKVDMWNDRDRRLAKCSKGMKQRLGLATCLIREPRLLFLDEPTRGLDPVIGGRFREELLRMNESGSTVFLNSHVLAEVELICDRVAIVQEGAVVVEELLEDVIELDTESYRVIVEPIDDPPEFLSDLNIRNGRLQALCSREKAVKLFKLAEEREFIIYDCALQRQSLEEAFLETVGDDFR